MFRESDRAYIAVDSRLNRSMKSFIASADLAKGGKHGWLYQLVDLDSNGSRGKWHEGIPMGSLPSLSEELKSGLTFMVKNYALSNASGLVLASHTRRADLHGPDLQRAHEEAGKFLADKMMDEYGQMMGLVCNASFPHVQGGVFAGKAAAFATVIVVCAGVIPPTSVVWLS